MPLGFDHHFSSPVIITTIHHHFSRKQGNLP